MIAEADRQAIVAALGKISRVYRDVVVLREMENLSYTEIAQITGAPIGTMMSRLSRGRAELRKAVLQAVGDQENAV